MTEEIDDLTKNSNVLLFTVKAVQLKGNVVGEEIPIKAITIICTGRKTLNKSHTSTNLHPEDISGIGKDYVVDAARHTIFINDWIKYDSPTPTAIFYDQKIVNKGTEEKHVWKTAGQRITHDSIVYIKDASDELLNFSLTKMLAENDIDTVRTGENKKTSHIKVLKPALFITSAETSTAYQLLRRLPSLHFNPNAEQTKQITDDQLDRDVNIIDQFNKQDLSLVKSVDEYTKSLKYVYVDLKDVKSYIKEKLPKSHKIIMRTLNTRLQDYIKFSATFHQFQRKVIGKLHSKPVIAATKQDVDIGFEIFDYIYKDEFTDISLLNARQRNILRKLKENNGTAFIISKIMVWSESEGVTYQTIQNDLREIQRATSSVLMLTDAYPLAFMYKAIARPVTKEELKF